MIFVKTFVEGELVAGIARRFKFSHGEKLLVREETNRGVMAAWRRAWTWRDSELFVIIEDDVEMSPHWYRAAVNMWTKYGDRWGLLPLTEKHISENTITAGSSWLGWDSRTRSSVSQLVTQSTSLH